MGTYYVVDSCPYCKADIEGATSPFEDGGPSEGDFSVCYNCAGILRFGKNLKVRVPNDEDIAELEGDKELASTLNTVMQAVQRTNERLKK